MRVINTHARAKNPRWECKRDARGYHNNEYNLVFSKNIRGQKCPCNLCNRKHIIIIYSQCINHFILINHGLHPAQGIPCPERADHQKPSLPPSVRLLDLAMRKEILETMANLCALSVFLLSRKNRYSPTSREKCRFQCPLDQITPFPNKFTFFMYCLNQYTHSVSRVCASTAWIFNTLSKSKQEPVRVQWGNCWRGVRVIEKLLYDYWHDRRFINLIIMPLLLSTLAEFPFLFAD